MSKPTRSPLKDKPLRLPGQSLQKQLDDLIGDKLEPQLFMAAFMIGLAAMEWVRYFTQSPPNPWLVTFVAGVACGYAGWVVRRNRVTLRSLRQGIEGERAVGQYLERLREQGYQVFHDVQGQNFNLDHVLIGPAGVFTIETKTWSKPVKGDARVRFDGQTLQVGGHEPERDVMAQAAAQTQWLKSLLAESTGRSFDVRPVVLFPGWFVEATPGAHRTLWVLEPKALPTFLSNESVRMEAADIKLAAFHLSRYVRAGERELPR